MTSLKFDYKYWHRELEKGIQSSMRKLRETFLSKWTNRWIGIKEFIMTSLIKNTDKYLFEDTLSVLLKVMEKNQFLLDGRDIDI